MNGYLGKEIDKKMCEFVDKIEARHFVVEGEILSNAYYIELEGTIQSTQEECFRFIKSIQANENGMNRLIELKNKIAEMIKGQDLQFMSPVDVVDAITLIIDERDNASKVTELTQQNNAGVGVNQ